MLPSLRLRAAALFLHLLLPLRDVGCLQRQRLAQATRLARERAPLRYAIWSRVDGAATNTIRTTPRRRARESDFVSQSFAHSSCTALPHPHRQNAKGPISASVSSSWQMGQTSPSLTSRRSTARRVNLCLSESIHLNQRPERRHNLHARDHAPLCLE